MFAQLAPLALQRCHWYAKFVGLLLQLPFDAVSVWPSRAFPPMLGGAVLLGTAAAALAAKMPPAAASAAHAVRTRITCFFQITVNSLLDFVSLSNRRVPRGETSQSVINN